MPTKLSNKEGHGGGVCRQQIVPARVPSESTSAEGLPLQAHALSKQPAPPDWAKWKYKWLAQDTWLYSFKNSLWQWPIFCWDYMRVDISICQILSSISFLWSCHINTVHLNLFLSLCVWRTQSIIHIQNQVKMKHNGRICPCRYKSWCISVQVREGDNWNNYAVLANSVFMEIFYSSTTANNENWHLWNC